MMETRLVWAVLCLALLQPGRAAEPINVTAEVAALEHHDFAMRQRATQRLIQAEPDQALQAVAAAARGSNLEAALRATEILADWYGRTDLPAESADRIEAVLEELIPRLGSVAERASLSWELSRVVREKRTIAKLEALGARITPSEEFFVDVDEEGTQLPVIQHIVIGKKWRGGDEGLRYILRLTEVRVVYRVNGAPVTDAGIELLTDAQVRVEPRGAFLGVQGSQNVFGNDPEITGAIIDKVSPGSPAEKGGLRPGDVVQQFGGKPVAGFTELIEILKETEPGEKIEAAVLRIVSGEVKPLKLTIELNEWK